MPCLALPSLCLRVCNSGSSIFDYLSHEVTEAKPFVLNFMFGVEASYSKRDSRKGVAVWDTRDVRSGHHTLRLFDRRETGWIRRIYGFFIFFGPLDT